ncbi:hypothetical protein V6N13_015925 [Hibiscus sabdariffa]|uniref:Uncharacterized protein n=1 Tax=Hibiscus sabdariffa TaxID=183260 RepID=A0ABR2CX49_9ROSI
MEKKMMGFSSFLCVSGLVFFIISFNSVRAFQPPRATCENCLGFLDLCKPYLVGEVDRPHPACCFGLSYIYYNFDFTRHETRRTICRCIRKISVRDQYKPDRAKTLPVICFNIPFPVPLYPSDNDCKQ